MASKRPVVKVDKITGRIVAQYESVQQAANVEFITYDSLVNMMRRNTLGYSRYVFRYADKYNRHESFEGRRVNVPIELFYRGRYRYVSNQYEAAKLLHMARETVSDAVRHCSDAYGVKMRRMRFMGDISDDERFIVRKGE